jgi:flagellar hook-associated protein 1 FlgK
MSLTGALQIGNSALTASQLAIQVAGNNLANAATPGYSRQIAYLTALRANNSGHVSIGTGVRITDVRRQVDQALQSRMYAGLSHEAAAGQNHAVMSQIEATLGELGENDLSSELSKFFGSWSERANLIQSSAVVVQQGQRLSEFVRNMRGDFVRQRDQIDQQLGVMAQDADGLLDQIAQLNQAVSDAEAGGGRANSLRDQRDAAIAQLSQYMDVTAVEQNNGAVNILAGSIPIVLGSESRGIELQRRTENGKLVVSVNVKANGEQLDISQGQIGSLLANRDGAITDTIAKLDTLTSQLIFEVNKLHSTGSNLQGLTTNTATLGVPTGDRGLAFNDPANATFAGLPFKAQSGGFTVRVISPSGDIQSVRVNLDLDGRDASGAVGYGDDTTPEDVRSAIDGIDGLSATFGPDGKLKIDADPGFTFSFSEDSSSALAVMGVNAYFTGKDASDIGIRDALKANTDLLSTGRMVNGSFVENGTALGIAGLQDQQLAGLGNRSIKASWIDTSQALGVQAAAALSQAESAMIVRQSLDAQRAAVSGVSVDEESVNLLTFQRQYQGAAKFITTVDEMMQTLISMV